MVKEILASAQSRGLGKIVGKKDAITVAVLPAWPSLAMASGACADASKEAHLGNPQGEKGFFDARRGFSCRHRQVTRLDSRRFLETHVSI